MIKKITAFFLSFLIVSAMIPISLTQSFAAEIQVGESEKPEQGVLQEKTGSGNSSLNTVDNSNNSSTKNISTSVSSNTGTIVNVVSLDYLKSSHNYENNTDKTWVYTDSGVGKLKVTFSEETSVENGADFIYIYDKNDNQVGKYTGTKLSGVTVEIPGDTVKIRLVSDSSENDYGFEVTSVVALTSISIASLPDTTSYLIGQTPDSKGLKIYANYDDGTYDLIENGFALSNVNNKVIGNKTVTVSYYDLTTTFNYNFVQPEFESMKISSMPTRVKFFYGEKIDTTGLILTVVDVNENEYTVNTGYEISGYNSNTFGEQTITVTYHELSAEYKITVNSPIKYTVSNKQITVTGVSDSDVTFLYIPDTIGGYKVTQIANSAFKENNKLTKTLLPDTITSIGESAFNGCTNLESINIPDNLTEIKISTFSGCRNLKKVHLPDKITSIGQYAFNDCINLATVNIPDNVTIIETYAFYNCKKLCKINFPDGLITIGGYSFAECELITSLNVPNSVTSIGGDAFKGTNLETLKIPFVGYSRTATSSQGNFGYIFGGSSSNYSGTTCQYYGNNSYDKNYYYIPKTLKSVEITDATRIPDYAFYNCSMLENITLNDQITSVGNYAFYNCGDMILHTNKDTAAYEYAKSNNIKYSTIKNIVLSVDSITFSKGEQKLLTPTVYSLNGEIYSEPEITWTSSDTSVVSVNDKGLVKAVGPGNATITITCEGTYTKSIPVLVYSHIESISLNRTSANIDINNAITLSATFNPYNTTDDKSIIWKSSDESVAVVNEKGKVTAIGKGSAIITATSSNGCTAKCKVNVLIPTNEISFVEKTMTLFRNDVEMLKIIANPSDGTDTISWSSSNTNVATVDENGKIFAVAAGKTTITASTSRDVTAKIEIEVLPKALDSIEIFEMPKQTVYHINENIDLSGCKIKLEFDDGSYELVDVDASMISGYNSDISGTQTITVTYKNLTATFNVEVMFMLGDVNFDGTVSIDDATEIQKYLAQLVEINSDQEIVADTNGDGIISIDDATQIQKYLAQLIPSLG